MSLRSVVWLAAWSCACIGLNTAAHAQQLVSVNGRWYVMSNSPTVVTAAPTTTFVTMQPQWNSSLHVAPNSSIRSLRYSYGVDAGTTWTVAGNSANVFGWGSPFQPESGNPLLDRIESMLLNRFELWLDHELGLNPCPGAGAGAGAGAGGSGSGSGSGSGGTPTPVSSGQSGAGLPNNVDTMSPQELRNRSFYSLQAAQIQEQRTVANQRLQYLNQQFNAAATNAGLVPNPSLPQAKSATREALLEKAEKLCEEIQKIKAKTPAPMPKPV